MNEQVEMKLETTAPKALPPILTLREFVEQIEREYGSAISLDAVRAMMEEERP